MSKSTILTTILLWVTAILTGIALISYFFLGNNTVALFSGIPALFFAMVTVATVDLPARNERGSFFFDQPDKKSLGLKMRTLIGKPPHKQ